jgi:N-acetylglucosaminyl-diphospho-decaprenol L-rhamnosyltransferase
LNNIQHFADGICVSIVSHGHGKQVWELADCLVEYPEVKSVIITLNIPERVPDRLHNKIEVVGNRKQLGFAENHNNVFYQFCEFEYFCVLNPDVVITENFFGTILSNFVDKKLAICAPVAEDKYGNCGDNFRRFFGPYGLLLRTLRINRGTYKINIGKPVHPDWVSGMFMLFRSELFRALNGFDIKYRMYCEDVEICLRGRRAGYEILGLTSCRVLHDGARTSHRDLKYFFWHVRSLLRVWGTQFVR